MRFFQSESHSKPEDDNDDTVRSEPAPAQRDSTENNDDDHGTDISRDPDNPGVDRPHISTGRAADDPDADRTDSAARTGEPVDADVVFVEPAPQETAFGAATVGGAVAASEVAARREVDDDTTAVGTASVPPSTATDTDGSPSDSDHVDVVVVGDRDGSAHRAEGSGRVERADHTDGFGPAGRTGSGPAGRTGDAPADRDDEASGRGDRADEGIGHADRADEGFGPADRTGHVEGFAAAGRADAARTGDADDSRPADRTDHVEGFGAARTGDVEGFGATGRAGGDKPLRAEDVQDPDGTGVIGRDDDAGRDADGRTDADGKPLRAESGGVDETTALGVAAGAAAGAAASRKDRDRDGHFDNERVTADGEQATIAAVPIEPIPAETADVPATTDEPVELLPGDVPDQPALAAFFTQDKAADFRDRWREVQLRFVDDPAQAASDAGTLIDEVVAALNAAVTAQREALGGATPGQGDTERLRVLVRRQRDFLDRILGL